MDSTRVQRQLNLEQCIALAAHKPRQRNQALGLSVAEVLREILELPGTRNVSERWRLEKDCVVAVAAPRESDDRALDDARFLKLLLGQGLQ
jgi:hypothetical protein